MDPVPLITISSGLFKFKGENKHHRMESGWKTREQNNKDPDQKISDQDLYEWRGQDLNLRPSGYEPDELPNCSTPR